MKNTCILLLVTWSWLVFNNLTVQQVLGASESSVVEGAKTEGEKLLLINKCKQFTVQLNSNFLFIGETSSGKMSMIMDIFNGIYQTLLFIYQTVEATWGGL